MRVEMLAIAAVALATLSCSGARAQAPDVLQVRAIELVDEAGVVRAQLKLEDGGEVLFRLRDRTGAVRVKLGAGDDGSGLLLLNDATEPGFQALAKNTGTTLTLRNKDGTERTLRPSE